ncbi:MAG TPA: gamma-glutamyltransferase [Gemmataceae bacterium]|nr:gamma-glutamyltransferase [Gemmataceae bacterium]
MTPTRDRRQFLGSALLAVTAGVRAAGPTARGLVTGQPQGAEAGNAVLAAGGNAVDAVVSAALAAGVVAVPSTGIGGYGGHMVVARPGGKVIAIDFNSSAPAAAKQDMFPADEKGTVKGNINIHGWLAAGVPGILAGLQLALDKHGTKKFPELVAPSIRYARDGFMVSKALAASIKTASSRFAEDPGSSRLFLRNGEPLKEGERFRNPDLADMLQALADRGRVDDFYRGKIAERIAAAFRKNGGLLTSQDLAAYRAVEVTPLSLDWQGYTLHTPPPTAGGLTVLQTLAILKALDWSGWEPKDPATAHARVEALRVAWSDRLQLLGDPKHTDVPVARLLSKRYASECADRVRAAVKAVKPVASRMDRRPSSGTIHLNAVDASGMAVALTYTHGGGFGAQVAVDGLGLLLGHGMSRFDPRPGHPNSPGPGKRPLHNMCPTIVTRDGVPVLAVGATGGRRIPNTVFDVLTYRIGEGRPLADAVKAPRVHTEGDLALTLEKSWPAAVVARFERAGYMVRTGVGANLNAIERDPKSGELQSAAR